MAYWATQSPFVDRSPPKSRFKFSTTLRFARKSSRSIFNQSIKNTDCWRFINYCEIFILDCGAFSHNIFFCDATGNKFLPPVWVVREISFPMQKYSVSRNAFCNCTKAPDLLQAKRDIKMRRVFVCTLIWLIYKWHDTEKLYTGLYNAFLDLNEVLLCGSYPANQSIKYFDEELSVQKHALKFRHVS